MASWKQVGPTVCQRYFAFTQLFDGQTLRPPLPVDHAQAILIPEVAHTPEVLTVLSSEQIRAARALLRWEQTDLADASGVSLSSIAELETQPGELPVPSRTVDAICSAFISAGITFIDDHASSGGGGPGLRLTASPKVRMSEDEDIQYKEYLNPDASFGSGG